MTRELRPYQAIAVQNIHEAWTIYRSALLVLATGLGKTFTAASVLADRRRAGRTLWIAHRRELISQAREAIESCGMRCEIEMAEQWANLRMEGDLFGGHGAEVVIASVQTLTGARLRRFACDAFATIVIDEAHHATAQGYREIVAHFADARVLGLTATPDRGDGVGLRAVFDAVAYEYGIREGIREGYLSPIVQRSIECADLDLSDIKTVRGDLAEGELARAMEADAVLHQVAAPLVQHAGDRPTIVFTASVDQAHALVDALAGYTQARAAAIDGTTPDDLRRRILREYSAGEIQYLANCAVLTEGFDAPRTSCIAMARPTKSRSLYTQCIGRGTRLFTGKADCLVLDFVGNSGRHTLINPLDVLAGRDLPDDVRREAARKAASGMPSEDALAEAEREAQERAERAERERARKARVRAEVAHRAREVDPFGVMSGPPDAGPRASSGQVAALEKFGLAPAQAQGMSRREASRMVDELIRRAKGGLCSYKQARVLAKHGLRSDISRREASEVMDALARNGWRPTPEMRARWGARAEAAE